MAGSPRSGSTSVSRRAARRAPRPEQRQRDADRSRQRILDAAAEAFSERGFAGARVAQIAKRAGVNAQLITYYFGGKQGLYEALRDAWAVTESGFATPDQPFDAVVRGYVDAVLDEPERSRLLLWQALGDSGDSAEGRENPQAERLNQVIEDIRRRQEAGELTSDFDPGVILIVLWASAMAPLSSPQVVRAALGDALSGESGRAHYAGQLRHLFSAGRPS